MSLNFKKIELENCSSFPKDKVNIPSLIEDLEFIKAKRPLLYKELENLTNNDINKFNFDDNSKENVESIQHQYFIVKAYKFLEQRFITSEISEEAKPYYLDRFKFELDIISKMKFEGYTLLVSDFLRTLKIKLGGLIGPGRGSAAGSLVSWAFEITNVDPMLHYKNTSSHLLFERYLNPERISLPDIDMDMNGLINKEELVSQLRVEYTDETTKTFLSIIDKKYAEDEYLVGKALIEDYQVAIYGSEKISKIVTRDTYQAKSAIASVCRYLGNDFANESGFRFKGTPYIEFANRINTIAFSKPGYGLKDVLDVKSKHHNQYFVNMYNSNNHVKKVVDLATKLEGSIANYGVHAAGVLILDPKNNYLNNGYMIIGGTNVSVLDGKYVEDYINIKFDFLGLASLEEIDRTLKFIEKRYGKEKRAEVSYIINNEKLLYEDKDIFTNVFDTQNTKKIFQFSSDGMQDLVKRVKPETFEELVAITALYRPGPMESGMVDMYVKNKFNKENVFVEFEELRSILEPTHQNLVYQEQIMKIVQVLGQFTLGGADLVRRAMGKKIKEELDALKDQFVDGTIKTYEGRHLTLDTLEKYAIFQEFILFYDGENILFNGIKEMNDLSLGEQFTEKDFGRLIIKKGTKLNISEDYVTKILASRVFDNIVKFAGYGFNKSHAYAYTNVSMQMAYLKAHFPLEFFASIFLNNSNDMEKLTEYIVDSKKNNIIVYGVDINKSNLEFDTIDDNAIIYGLSNIKGISNRDVKGIIKERINGEYKSFSDFLNRFIHKVRGSFKTIENLINVGAFDKMNFTQETDLGKLLFENALNKISITEDKDIYELRLMNKSNYLNALIDDKFDVFDSVANDLASKYLKYFNIENKKYLLPLLLTKIIRTKELTIKKLFSAKTNNAMVKLVNELETIYNEMGSIQELIVIPNIDKIEIKRAFFNKVSNILEDNKLTEKQVSDIEDSYIKGQSLITSSNIEFEATGSLSNMGSILAKPYVFNELNIIPSLNILLEPFEVEGKFKYKVVARDIIKGENEEGELYLSLVVLDIHGIESRFYLNNDQISRYKNNINSGDPLIIEVEIKEGKNTFYKKIVDLEVLKEETNWSKQTCLKPRPLSIKQLDKDKILKEVNPKVQFCQLDEISEDWRNSIYGWKGLNQNDNKVVCLILVNYKLITTKDGRNYQIISVSDGLSNQNLDLFYSTLGETELKANLNKPIIIELSKRQDNGYGLGPGYKTSVTYLADGYLKEDKVESKVQDTYLEILDGREHINVYSKGKTLLGRKLSNFADIPTQAIVGGELVKFKNLESLWFYLKIFLLLGERETSLLEMEGHEAKSFGNVKTKLMPPLNNEQKDIFIATIKDALKWKIENNEQLLDQFRENYNKLPYAHYYNYSGNVRTLPGSEWLVDFLNDLRV